MRCGGRIRAVVFVRAPMSQRTLRVNCTQWNRLQLRRRCCCCCDDAFNGRARLASLSHIAHLFGVKFDVSERLPESGGPADRPDQPQQVRGTSRAAILRMLAHTNQDYAGAGEEYRKKEIKRDHIVQASRVRLYEYYMCMYVIRAVVARAAVSPLKPKVHRQCRSHMCKV